jgi:hypothetical protein
MPTNKYAHSVTGVLTTVLYHTSSPTSGTPITVHDVVRRITDGLIGNRGRETSPDGLRL